MKPVQDALVVGHGIDLSFIGKDEKPVWPELDPAKVIHFANGDLMKIAVLEAGMSSGRASMVLRIDLPDGRTVIQEISERLFVTVADAVKAKFPEQFP